MFIGRYYYKLEEKQRLSLPKEFRLKAKRWVVTRGLDGGLFLMKQTDFEKNLKTFAQRTLTKKDNRDFVRLMAHDAKAVTPDKLGRVKLPAYLTELAGLKKEVVIVGSYDYIEIWDKDKYHTYLEKLEKQAEQIAERLSDEPN